MKKLAVIFCSAVIVLCGCAAQKDVVPMYPSSTAILSETSSVPTEFSEELTTTSEDLNVPYSVSGMTDAEIFALLINLSDDINTGDTVLQFENKFSVAVWETSSNRHTYYFWSAPDTSDYIRCITYDVQDEMDGSIKILPDSRVSVDLILSDYDTAAALYDSLFTYLCETRPDGRVHDDREGTSWDAGVSWDMLVENHEDYQSYIGYSLQLRLTKDTSTGNYLLTVDLPLEK